MEDSWDPRNEHTHGSVTAWESHPFGGLWEAQGGLGKGPLKTQHTRRWTAEEVAVPTLGPTRPSRGATRPSVCQGAHSLHLRSPWAESRRRVEWDPLDSQAIWDGMDAVPKREDQSESTSPGEDPQSKGIRSIPWPGSV